MVQCCYIKFCKFTIEMQNMTSSLLKQMVFTYKVTFIISEIQKNDSQPLLVTLNSQIPVIKTVRVMRCRAPYPK